MVVYLLVWIYLLLVNVVGVVFVYLGLLVGLVFGGLVCLPFLVF